MASASDLTPCLPTWANLYRPPPPPPPPSGRPRRPQSGQGRSTDFFPPFHFVPSNVWTQMQQFFLSWLTSPIDERFWRTNSRSPPMSLFLTLTQWVRATICNWYLWILRQFNQAIKARDRQGGSGGGRCYSWVSSGRPIAKIRLWRGGGFRVGGGCGGSTSGQPRFRLTWPCSPFLRNYPC